MSGISTLLMRHLKFIASSAVLFLNFNLQANAQPLRCEQIFSSKPEQILSVDNEGVVRAGGVVVTGESRYPLAYVLRNLRLEPGTVLKGSVLSVGEGTSGLLPHLLRSQALRDQRIEAADIWYHTESYPEGTAGRQMREYVQLYGDHLIQADARKIPRESGTYDLILSHLLINNTANTQMRIQIAHEMVRLLSVGGEARIFGFRHDRYALVVNALKEAYGDALHIKITHPTIPEGMSAEQFDPWFANRYRLMVITKVHAVN